MEESRSNVEEIIKYLTKNSIVKTMEKIDGITIECTIPSRKTFKKCEESIREAIKDLDLDPLEKQLSFEQSTEDTTKFALQFPELMPYYTIKEIEKMYEENFKMLLNQAILRASFQNVTTLTREVLLKGVELYTREAIKIFFKSNCNQYKRRIEEFLQDPEYRTDKNRIFYNMVDEVASNKGIL